MVTFSSRTKLPPHRFPWCRGAAAIVFSAIAVMAVPHATADNSNTQTPPEPVLDMRYAQVEKVQLVMIPAGVTDKKGRPVAGLTARDFTLTVDGQPKEIEFFATESNAPVALAFLLDLSGSMRQPGKLDAAKEAIRSMVEVLGREDQYGLIGFADHQVTWITDFTSNATLFKKRLDVQEGFGQTALYDALAASPHLVDEKLQTRKAIILFTDGLDNVSEMPVLQAVQVARQVSVPIYAVNFIQAAPEMLSTESREALLLLARFCRETGGQLITIRKPTELAAAMSGIQNDLRLQYVLGFQQDSENDSQTFRRIRLATNRSSLSVRCRSGYYPNF